MTWTAEQQQEMEDAFRLVAPENDWKAKIEKTITFETIEERNRQIDAINRAIVHFTATVPSFTIHPSNSLTVTFTAIGYRSGPAGP